MKGGWLIGAGIDLVENARMRAMIDRWGCRFKNRVFHASEQAYCESKAFPIAHYAGRFAVKEAVSKAFGTGVGTQVSWLDIEVTRDHKSGAPSVSLGPRAENLAERMGANHVLVSLSHTDGYSIAHALLLGVPPHGAEPAAAQPAGGMS